MASYTYNGTVYPDATTTGVPAGVTLTQHNGDLVVTTPGAVISGLNITGSVIIKAPNVTIENCSITSNDFAVINIYEGVTGTVVQNCTINGTGAGPGGQNGIGGAGTFLNNNIFGVENGINVEGSNTVIKGNYIHDLNDAAGSVGHYDGIQVDGGFNNVTISGNTVLGRDTSCIFICNDFGAMNNIVVDSNLLLGQNNAAASIYVIEKADNPAQITNVQVTNNVIGKGFWYWASVERTEPVWTNNVDYATGKIISTQNVLSSGPATPPPTPTPPGAPDISSWSPDTGKTGDGITNANKIDLKGTAAAKSTVTVYDNGTKIGTATADANGSWDYITGILTDAKHVLTAKATNGSGQTGAASAALNVTVDTVVATPLVASNSVVNINHVQLSGTAEAGSAVKIYDGTTVVGTGTANSSGAWSITTGVLSSGAHGLKVTATDVAGNVSAMSQASNATIPPVSTPPTAPAAPKIVSFSDDSGKANDNITNDNTLTLSGTAAANSTVKVFDGTGTTPIGTAKADGNGQWTLTTTALSDGAHNLTATATDGSSQTSNASAALSVTIDTTVPKVPVISSSTAAGSGAYLLKGTAEADSTISVFDGTKQVGTIKADASGAWSYTVSSLSVGTHSLTAKAVDVAGNTSGASAAVSPVVSGSPPPTAPAAPNIVSLSQDTGANANDRITSDSTLMLAGTALANSTVNVFDGTSQVGTAKVDGSGQWSLTTSTLSDAIHNLTATDTDSSGHTSAATSLSVTVDTHAPVTPTMAVYSQSGSTVGNTTTLDDLMLKGTAEANSTIKVFDGGKQIGTATTNDKGAWNYDTGHLADGNHSFSATAIDVAGNASGASAAKGVMVKDSASPTGSVDFTDVSGNWNHTATIKGTGDAFSQIKLYDGNDVVGSVKVGADGTWSYTTSKLYCGVHTFKAQEVDSSGHTVATSSGKAIVGSDWGNSLTSTSGNDVFVGKGHGDTFVFAANFGNDLIADFAAGSRGHDTIQFSKSVFDNFASVLSHASQVGQDVVISAGNDSLTLKNTKIGVLNSHDFHFA